MLERQNGSPCSLRERLSYERGDDGQAAARPVAGSRRDESESVVGRLGDHVMPAALRVDHTRDPVVELAEAVDDRDRLPFVHRSDRSERGPVGGTTTGDHRVATLPR